MWRTLIVRAKSESPLVLLVVLRVFIVVAVAGARSAGAPVIIVVRTAATRSGCGDAGEGRESKGLGGADHGG